MATVLLLCLARPQWGGLSSFTPTWGQQLRSLPDLLPTVAIFLLVIGSIYAGWATPTESASLGVVGSLFIAARLPPALNWPMMRAALLGTMRTTGHDRADPDCRLVPQLRALCRSASIGC